MASVVSAETSNPAYVGVTFAAKEVDVAAEIGGILEEVHVRLGDRVDGGAALASIRDEPVRRKLTMAEAAKDEAQAQRDQRAVELELAQQRVDRRQKLKDVLSEEEFSELVSRRDAARAALAAAEALVAERRAMVGSLQDDLARTRIHAPFAGTVSRCHQDAGALLQEGAPVVRILSEDIWVRFAVPPDAAQSLESGRQVALRCEGIDQELSATIRHIAPDVDPMADMVFVEAQLGETDSSSLAAGMVARVRLVEDVVPSGDRSP